MTFNNGEIPLDRSWLDELENADLNFIRNFVLSSGSLKELARIYEVSYPTIRLRLDRLIAKIEVIEAHRLRSPVEILLRTHFSEGKLDETSFQRLLKAYREEGEQSGGGGE